MRWLSRLLIRYLATPNPRYSPIAMTKPGEMERTIRRGDVLLVEGSSKFSTAIKYLTQSTWSHAALYIGESTVNGVPGIPALIEADLEKGVAVSPLSDYKEMHTRICRPVGLTESDIDSVIGYAVGRVGNQYDTKNIIDLLRYLVPTPPVPVRWRRRLLALGSGEPTRAICSTLIAQSFQLIRYPILPLTGSRPQLVRDGAPCNDCEQEFLRIRHHSLFAPRDFDLSPYFQVVKPVSFSEFSHHKLVWDD
jgi:Permuted papain-like amidase enzyme, YaeF/YiiX, C92 family